MSPMNYLFCMIRFVLTTIAAQSDDSGSDEPFETIDTLNAPVATESAKDDP